MLAKFDTSAPVIMFVDASVQPCRTGLGLVLRSSEGHVIGWSARTDRGMTNNEAEYAAVVFGLEQAEKMSIKRVRLFSDSRVVVEQMRGLIGVNNASLRRWHAIATRSAKRLEQVTFTHVPREMNSLADAIAADVLLRGVLQRVLQEK
jgi:ribonuclease HI